MRQITLGLRKQNADGVITSARAIKDAMTANADLFANPSVTMAALGNAITELQEAQTATVLGGPPAFELRNTKRGVVENYLKQLANYVQNVANGDANIIYLAGMRPKALGPRRVEFLNTPENLRAKNLLSGQVSLRWKKVSYARSYAVEYCVDPISADGWKAAVFNTGANAVVSGLAPLTRYWFRVRALGTESMVSEWSDAAMIVVV